MTSAGTCRADREVDSPEMEDGTEIHVDGRVHRLEDDAISEHGRIMFLIHDFGSFDDGFGRRIVAENTSHLIFPEILIRNLGLLKSLNTCHIGIFSLFRHSGTRMAVEHLFGNDRFLHYTGQSRTVAVFQSFRLDSDTRFSCV